MTCQSLGVVIGSRAFFSPAPCHDARDEVLAQLSRPGIDGLVICLPNFGDEIATIELVNRARLGVPILLRASNDDQTQVTVTERRDAFCGRISISNNFWQYGSPFTETTSHSCDVSGAEFGADLNRFARLRRTVRGLRGARLGAIDARTRAFQTMLYSEKQLWAAHITEAQVRTQAKWTLAVNRWIAQSA